MPGSASRRRSSSPGRGSPRPTIRATRRRSWPPSMRDGVTVRLGVRATPGRGRRRDGWRARASTSTTARPPRVTPSCSRSGATFPIDDLGLEHYDIDTTGRDAVPARRPAPDRRRALDRRATRPARSCTRTRATTRASWPSGWRSASRSCPDYRALPRATYTEPEAASVGLTLERRPRRGPRRLRARRRLRRRARGATASRPTFGHVTIVVDRATRAAGRGGDGLPGCVGRDPRVRAGDPGRTSRSTSWPRRSTPSRRRRGSSTACSPTPAASWTGPGSVVGATRPSARRRPDRPSGRGSGEPSRGAAAARPGRRGSPAAARRHRPGGRR